MPVIRLSTPMRNAMLDGLAACVDGGGADRPGSLSLYEGTMPATPDDAVGGSKLLATLPFSFPAFLLAEDGELEAQPIEQQNGLANGKATWARIWDGFGAPVLDGDVGIRGRPGAAAFVSLQPVDIVAGGPVILRSIKLRLPVG